MKLKIEKPSTKECPQCGGKTVVEDNIRICDGLIDPNDTSLPLVACPWEEQIHKNGKPVC